VFRLPAALEHIRVGRGSAVADLPDPVDETAPASPDHLVRPPVFSVLKPLIRWARIFLRQDATW